MVLVIGLTIFLILITENGKVDRKVERRVAMPLWVLGLCNNLHVFKESHLSVDSKHQVYSTCILLVLYVVNVGYLSAGSLGS